MTLQATTPRQPLPFADMDIEDRENFMSLLSLLETDPATGCQHIPGNNLLWTGPNCAGTSTITIDLSPGLRSWLVEGTFGVKSSGESTTCGDGSCINPNHDAETALGESIDQINRDARATTPTPTAPPARPAHRAPGRARMKDETRVRLGLLTAVVLAYLATFLWVVWGTKLLTLAGAESEIVFLGTSILVFTGSALAGFLAWVLPARN